jgi:hypothetical protein
MFKIYKSVGMVLAATLAACGGGGGSGGSSNLPYSISLRAEKLQLPINISNVGAGIGAYAAYTTTIYVEAREGGAPIPGGEDIFGCNVSQGLDSGSLYYLDGDEDHEDDDGNPLSYRSITLGSNSGGASFHFHAGTKAGVARIVCSVTNPSDGNVSSASVDITVGAATGQAASIQGIAQIPVLGTQGNQANIRTSTAVDAFVLDDANQPLPNSSHPNLQVNIRPVGDASNGARLIAGPISGSVLQVRTIGGVGLFSLSSGASEGPILLEMTADRRDNDVSNGIQDPIVHLLVVNSTRGSSSGSANPVVIAGGDLASATNGLPYSFALTATGGVPPYSWNALGALPDGLTLNSAGLLSGTPMARIPGDFQLAVSVTDTRGVSTTGNFTLTVDGTPAADPTTIPLAISLPGCTADINGAACPLPVARLNTPYQYVLTATGSGSGAVTWSFESAKPASLEWLTLSASGILEGTPAACGNLGQTFFIRATKAGASSIRKVTIRGESCP